MKRRAALVVLLATAFTGCGAPSLTTGSGAGSGTARAPAAAPEKIAAAPPATSPAPKPNPAAKPTAAPQPTAAPKPNACAKNTAAQLVKVSVTQQRLWLCAQKRVVYSAAVTTGAVDLAYDSTPTGTFQIQGKTTDTTLTLLSGQTYAVKYWIPFDGPLFGFHDSSWQNFPYGSARYRTEGSHGCVHTPLAAMRFLYDWAAVGATVIIRP